MQPWLPHGYWRNTTSSRSARSIVAIHRKYACPSRCSAWRCARPRATRAVGIRPRRAVRHGGVMAFVLSGRGAWETTRQSDAGRRPAGELAARCAPGCRRRLASGDPRAARPFPAAPILPRPAAATARAGLWLAGDYVCADYPATLEAAVRSGVARLARERKGHCCSAMVQCARSNWLGRRASRSSTACIRTARRDLVVVGDENQRRAALGVDRKHQLDDLMPGRRIEIAGRLVGQHQSRLPGAKARASATRCCSPPERCFG
jgi:hypothetical protein